MSVGFLKLYGFPWRAASFGTRLNSSQEIPGFGPGVFSLGFRVGRLLTIAELDSQVAHSGLVHRIPPSCHYTAKKSRMSLERGLMLT